MRLFAYLAVLLIATACVEFPDVDAAVDEDVEHAAFPVLVPIEEIVTPPSGRLDDNSAAVLDSRVSGLNHRAEALRRLPTE